MINRLSPLTFVLVSMLMVSRVASGAVLTLEFSGGGNSTTPVTNTVDAWTGMTGSGWSSVWSSEFRSTSANGAVAVENSAPIVAGDGNYLHVTYNKGTGEGQAARVSRQWNTSAISLTQPITMSFDLRTDTQVAGNYQTFTIFGSSSATPFTSGNDSWQLASDGGGWYARNQTSPTTSTLVKIYDTVTQGAITANSVWHFELTINPLTDTYGVVLTNLATNLTYSVSDLGLRNGADSSLSYINFISNVGSLATTNGFSIDNISVVPEPAVVTLLVMGLLGGFSGRVMRRHSRGS